MSTLLEHSLLIGRNRDLSLGPFDGRVAAVVKEFVCTTPNQDRIFLPPLQKREVHLRADFRYGPDDPTLWPQPWVSVYCHLGAIPRKPDDSNNPLSIMWWNPTRDDFKCFDSGIVDGLGDLSRTKLLSLQAIMTSLEDRVEDHKKSFPKPNHLLLSLVKAMQDAYHRLSALKTTFSEMRFGVTEFQRYYLEVHGCLDYLELYKPRMDGRKPPAETVANCIGAFTHTPRVAQDFHTAGLPVWLLRPSKSWDTPFQCNILELVTPIVPTDILTVSKHDPPFPPIFCGPANDPNRHSAIHTYSRTWLVFKDPFEVSSNVSKPRSKRSNTQSADISPPGSSRSLLPGASSSRPQTIQAGDRDKFSPLDRPYTPFSIPAWSAALQAVDQSSSHLQPEALAQSGHFTFPDPGLFTNTLTAAKYLESWLRVRDIWFMRVEKEPSLAMSSQTWRTFLSMDINAPENGNTKAARRRQESLGMLMPKSNMYPEVKMRSIPIGGILWQGEEYPSGVMPPEDVVRQILWELYEVNFVHELQSLDRRACSNLDLSNTARLFERQIEIAQCFPVGSFRHISIPSENRGLAADDLETRFGFITALIVVMKSWKGEKPIVFNAPIENLHKFTLQAVQHTEQVVAKYYCQTFFNYFGRAAQIPHRLFATNNT